MKNKTVIEEADDVRRAVEMVQLGARMQMLEVETRLSRPAKGGKKVEDQQDTAWDHIHSGFMAGTL